MTTIELPEMVAEGAIAHMNADHQHNLLDYAKVLAGCDWAESATMSAIDAYGFDLVVTGDGQEESRRITFPEPVSDAQSLRMTLVHLAQQADLPDGIRRVSNAEVATEKGIKYMKTLCNHFARKADASYSDNKGTVKFPFGECEMIASEHSLQLMVAAESETMLDRTRFVVADHLIRFAPKESLEVNWVDKQ